MTLTTFIFIVAMTGAIGLAFTLGYIWNADPRRPSTPLVLSRSMQRDEARGSALTLLDMVEIDKVHVTSTYDRRCGRYLTDVTISGWEKS